MAHRVCSLVWDRFPGLGSELLIMLALAEWANEAGECFPSMASIATRARLSRAQTQRVVHKLIADGMIAVVGNHNGGPPGSSRKYRINIERLRGLADATPQESETGIASDTPTGLTDATGRTDATGLMDAREGSHTAQKTGLTDATLTVIEPSKNRKRARSERVSFSDWMADCKQAGRQPIPETDAVFAYAEKVRLPDAFLALAWFRFRSKYGAESDKRYKDWPATFRNAVKDNWGKIWAIDGQGNYYLTTVGKQLQAEKGAA